MKDQYSNSLISELMLGKEISREELSKIYRHFCKKTHPDLTGKDGREFMKVQEEYKEAKAYLEKIRESFRTEKTEEIPAEAEDPRQALFYNLKRYSALGLHSARVRLRPNLKERNAKLCGQVSLWARLYDPSFIPIFTAYNRNHLDSLRQWRAKKRLREGRRIFISGMNFFLDYMLYGDKKNRHIGRSYLEEARDIMLHLYQDPVQQAILQFSKWLLKELKKGNQAKRKESA